MFDRFSRTWELTKQSFKVLAGDKQMMVFPVLSTVAAIVVSVSFLIPVISAGMFAHRGQPTTNAEYGILFLFYFANYFVIVFFNSALVYCASVGLSGGHATVKDGLSAAWGSLGRIFMWALVAATVGLMLRILEERLGKLGRIIVWLLGMAWTLMTYFIVPVLVFEDNLSMVDSVKRSGSVLRETWGEEVVSGFSFGLIWLLAMVPGFALLVGGMMVHPLAGIALGVLYFLLLWVVAATVKTIFTVALYRYATQGQVPAGFTPALIEGAFTPKGKRPAAGA
ncbi:MAG: DUF6159 family protein [Acidobacteriia bacterium]|nr:DUF6159 family protein [Terriglobia bacterium]